MSTGTMSHDLRPRQPPCKKAELEIQNLLQRPAGAGTNFQAQFYPRDKILNFLNREEVEKVLLCKCHNCSEHLGCLSQEEGSNQSPRQYLDNIIPFQGNGQRAVSLFALMIILRYPLLIIPLLSRNYRDASFLDEYHRDTSKDRDTEVPRLKKFFECLGPDEAGALAERFWENVFKFAVPFLHGKDFTIYHANTVLPFLTSERLGGGAFGDVFAFTIYAHYNNLPVSLDAPQSPVYSP
jgi:hypothetical protein